MDNLIKANDTIRKIAAIHPEFTPITPADKPLFEEFFAKEPFNYGNSWPYIIQGMYGIGELNLGYKYYDGKNLAAVCVYPRVEFPDEVVFYWVRPMGPQILQIMDRYTTEFITQLNIPTSITKVFESDYKKLLEMGFEPIENLPWHPTAPAEDDSYPEIVNMVHDTVINTPKRKRIKKAVRQFEKISEIITVHEIVTTADREKAWHVAERFFKQDLISLEHNLSTQYDYYNIIFSSIQPQHHVYLIQKGDLPVGFFDYYQMNDDTACAYASLMLREIVPTLEDFTMIWLFKHLDEKGIKYLNQGGSETEGMDQYKRKFVLHEDKMMYWCVRTK